MRRRILSENVSDEKIFLFFSLLGKSIPHLVLLSARRRTIYWRTADYEHRGEGGVERMGGPLWSPVVTCLYPPQGPLSPTVLGHPCIERRREAWHPQGPIHPQPHPVPLHVLHSCSHSRRAVVWWWGGFPICSGTGWQGGAVGPLWVPGVGTTPKLSGERSQPPTPLRNPGPISSYPSSPPSPLSLSACSSKYLIASSTHCCSSGESASSACLNAASSPCSNASRTAAGNDAMTSSGAGCAIVSSTRSTSNALFLSIPSTSACQSRSPAQMRRVAAAIFQPFSSSCGKVASTASRALASPFAAAAIAAMSCPCWRSIW